MNRRLPWLLLGLLLTACGPSKPEPRSFAGTEPVQVRVVWTEAPQHRALIAWTTAEPGASHELLLADHPGIELDGEDLRRFPAANGAYVPAAAREPQPTAWFHHAPVTGLEASTTYWFRVRSDDQLSAEFHFVTAPADGRPFTLVAGSDSRSERDGRRAMNRRLAELLAENADILALAHGGDYEWAGHELDDWLRWLDDHELTTTPAGRLLPIIPTRGNHEAGGVLFDQAFGSPGGTRRNWFATELSPLVTLITLNTNLPGGGPQRQFLERALRDAQDARFRLAQYHEPIYPSVKAPVGAAPHWLPLFDELRLDVALESDGHTLKRTPPIRGGHVDPDGVVYIGEGGLGVRQRSPKTDRWYLQKPGFATRTLHVWCLDFDDARLTLRAVDEGGDERDRYVVQPRQR